MFFRKIIYAINNIGCIFFEDKNYNKAINHFEKALSIRKKIDNKIGVSESLEGLVETYITIKNYPKAKHYIGESINNYKKLGNENKVEELTQKLNLLTS